MSNLEIQDVFEPYFDGRKPTVKTLHKVEIVEMKRRYTRVARRGEAIPRDTEIVVAHDVQSSN